MRPTLDSLRAQELQEEEQHNPAPSMMDPPRPRPDGCVTNFDHGEKRLTIWKHGDHFTLSVFGVFGERLSFSDDPLFQSIAREMHRLACEVGMLRRKEIERAREATTD